MLPKHDYVPSHFVFYYYAVLLTACCPAYLLLLLTSQKCIDNSVICGTSHFHVCMRSMLNVSLTASKKREYDNKIRL